MIWTFVVIVAVGVAMYFFHTKATKVKYEYKILAEAVVFIILLLWVASRFGLFPGGDIPVPQLG